MKRIAIVSPSGNFYGSEQVLYDFLSCTHNNYHIYLPSGLLYNKLKELGKHSLHTYGSLKLLYVKLAIMLFVGKYDGIYINEGGHVKYVNILADLFPHKHFFVHIRLLEDTYGSRLGQERKNVSYVSVSEYITGEVKRNSGLRCCSTLIDIYNPISGFDGMKGIKLHDGTLRVGIIGRVTVTKGLHDISTFCDYCEKHPMPFGIEFHFFGGLDSHLPEVGSFVERAKSYRHIKCIFHGFVSDKPQIYSSSDLLLHFNRVESLGRIIMEALDFGIPFIGFKDGGIGELARNYGVEKFMVEYGNDWEERLQNKIINLVANNESIVADYGNAKALMKELCSPATYTQHLEALLYE